MPLFGFDWARAFGIEITGVKVRRVKQDALLKITDENRTKEAQVQGLLQEYAELFKGQGGTIKNYKAVVHLRDDAKPVRFRCRPVPFSMMQRVEKELDRLVGQGTIEEVDPATTPILWASPTVNVEKKNGAVRICGDFKVTINPYMVVDRHPMPTFEEITVKLNGGKKFSVIDLKDAYLQLPVDEDSQNLLVIATHKGYYRYKRCPFGIASASGIFQGVMDKILHGLDGVGTFLDDTIVTGRNDEEHLANLRRVFERLLSAGIVTGLEKCKFLQPSVQFLGHRIDAAGIHPTEDKIVALRDQPTQGNSSWQLTGNFVGVDVLIRYDIQTGSFSVKRQPPLHSMNTKAEREIYFKLSAVSLNDKRQRVWNEDSGAKWHSLKPGNTKLCFRISPEIYPLTISFKCVSVPWTEDICGRVPTEAWNKYIETAARSHSDI